MTAHYHRHARYAPPANQGHKTSPRFNAWRFAAMILGVAGGLTLWSGASIAQDGRTEGAGGARKIESDLKFPDVKFMDSAALQDFYTARRNEPYWMRGRNDTRRAEEMKQLIAESWTHGLNPQSYHLDEITALLADPRGENGQRLELLLTDAAMRYARDLGGMRVDVGALGLKTKYWRHPPSAPAIAQNFAQSRDIPALLRAAGPHHQLYKKMQDEMRRLYAEGAQYDHLLPLDFGGGLFRPGQSHRDVPKLRAYMKVTYNPARGPATYYDDTLASAVMDFQYRHSLSPDGIIGPSTLDVINRSAQGKMRQLVANMERLRWIDHTMPGRYMMVNIPSQRLWAVEDGKVVLDMKVIVGLPSRQTKQFVTEVTGVRFNPTWTVPLNLKMADFLPKLIEDPGYLHDKGIQISQDGMSIDPYAIDWATVTRQEMNTLRFTQRPGDHNALGRIRILMPSDYDIYLHDTNHPEYFGNVNRALSSGCVRMADPQAVADFILQGNGNWSRDRMSAIIENGRMTEIMAENRFPVYLLYQSVWLDEEGGLVYGPDIYRQDKMLIDMLARANAYALPRIATMAQTEAPSRLAARE